MGEVVPFPISDLRLAQLCALDYTQRPMFESADAHVSVTIELGYAIVSLRGSSTILDWIYNLMIAPGSSVAHPELGICHGAYLADALAVANALITYLKRFPFVICGHSKGGSEAQLLAGLLVSAGLIPARLVTFGAPRCAWIGNVALPKLIGSLPGLDYRGGPDEVPAAPLPYIHPRETALKQLGDPAFRLNWIPFHLLDSYERLLAA